MKDFIKYLPVSEQEKDWGFYVTTAGHKKILPRETYPNTNLHPDSHLFTWNKGRILNDYSFVFIANGGGVFENTRGSFPVEAGTVFLLYPQAWHRYKPDAETGWEEYWVGFKGNYPEYLMGKSFPEKDNPLIHIGHNQQLQLLLHQLMEKIEAGGMGFHQIISGITLQILGTLHHAITTNNTPIAGQFINTCHTLINKARFMMNEAISEKINMEDIARSLPMGYSNFRKLFKTETGLSPNQYLLEIRLSKAKDLLADPELSINDIAFRCGFDSITHFSKLFQQKNKISATGFRKQLRENLSATV